MSHDKTKKELTNKAKEFIYKKYPHLTNPISGSNPVIDFELLDLCEWFYEFTQHELSESKGEIERLDKDNDVLHESNFNSCTEIDALKSKLSEKDKEIEALRETIEQQSELIKHKSQQTFTLYEENNALREGISGINNKLKRLDPFSFTLPITLIESLLNPSNEKGV